MKAEHDSRRHWFAEQGSKVCFGDASVYKALRVKLGYVNFGIIYRFFAEFVLTFLRVGYEC